MVTGMTSVASRDQHFASGFGKDPWAQPPGPPASGGAGDGKEPVFRAPWPVLIVVISILGLYAVQSLAAQPEHIEAAFGFSPADFQAGRWGGLVTALFVHAGWPHAALNAVAALAFGAPVARLFGTGLWRGLVFFAFYILCGVVGSLGFAMLHLGSSAVLVGASGAVSGLMGAASRLIEREGALAPFSNRTVIGMGLSWAVVNLLLAVFGFTAVSGGAPVAWEAHLFGYATGLLAIGPIARLLKRG
jgi:membrane associated rhomboid family serine protease